MEEKICPTGNSVRRIFLALVHTHSEHDHSDSLRSKELRFSGFSEGKDFEGEEPGRQKEDLADRRRVPPQGVRLP